MITEGPKKIGRINEGFLQENLWLFAWQPKKAAVITR